MRTIPYPTPVEILLEEFLNPLAITPAHLAEQIDISHSEMQRIISGNQLITAEIGLKLSRYFDVSEGFWTGLQDDYNHAVAKDKLRDTLLLIQPVQSHELIKTALAN